MVREERREAKIKNSAHMRRSSVWREAGKVYRSVQECSKAKTSFSYCLRRRSVERLAARGRGVNVALPSGDYLSLFASVGGLMKKEDGLTTHQRYYRKNKDGNAVRVAKWNADNPERNAAACKRSYAAHAEQRREYARKRYQETRGVATLQKSRRERTRINMQNRRSAGRVTKMEWAGILAEHGSFCYWCKAVEVPLEMDHVSPISKGGKHEKANIVPSCRPCNASRGNRHDTPPRLMEKK